MLTTKNNRRYPHSILFHFIRFHLIQLSPTTRHIDPEKPFADSPTDWLTVQVKMPFYWDLSIFGSFPNCVCATGTGTETELKRTATVRRLNIKKPCTETTRIRAKKKSITSSGQSWRLNVAPTKIKANQSKQKYRNKKNHLANNQNGHFACIATWERARIATHDEKGYTRAG